MKKIKKDIEKNEGKKNANATNNKGALFEGGLYFCISFHHLTVQLFFELRINFDHELVQFSVV